MLPNNYFHFLGFLSEVFQGLNLLQREADRRGNNTTNPFLAKLHDCLLCV